MSRSNPHDNGATNPAVRWFEWNGEQGVVRYYDKDKKQTIDVGSKFGFVLLDQLGSVRGWHESSKSGIYSNEVRDTRQDVLIVKSFKHGLIAEGLYKDIRDRVKVAGGQFVANLYIAFKHEGAMTIGSLRIKGAALGAWMEFEKANRGQVYKQAVEIHGFTEGKKGRITFRMPVLHLRSLSDETNARALQLDQELQEFLTGYLKRTKRDQVEQTAATQPPPVDDENFSSDDFTQETADHGAGGPSALTDDDIPF